MALAQRLTALPEPRRPRDVAGYRRPQPRPRRIAVVWAFTLVGLWVVVVGTALFLVHQYAQMARAQDEVTELKRAVAELEAGNQALTAQVTRLSSLDRIERIAASELGMVPPVQVRPAAVVALPAPQPLLHTAATLAQPEPGLAAWWGEASGILARVRAAVAGVRLAPARAEAAGG